MPIQQMFLGLGGKDAVYLEDIYSSVTYTGTGSAHTIVNGIDLSTEGGMVMLKRLDTSSKYIVYDTKRGVKKRLETTGNDAEFESSNGVGLYQFNTNGFTLGTPTNGNENTSGADWVAHTFRICPKFFDIQVYTGNSVKGRTISHDLGCVPGMIWIKDRHNGADWTVYHRKMDDSSPQNYHANLNNTDAREADDGWWNNTAPTSSVVTIGNKDQVNYSSRDYVMYLFAHDEAAFGSSGTEKITYCGGGSGYGGFAKEDLGWKPSYTMFKQVTSTNSQSSWFVNDEIIGRSATHPTSNLSYPDAGYSAFLRYQNMSIPYDSADQGVYTATSQTHNGTGFTMYSSNQTITYSIRSVDGYTCKKPDAGTDLLWLGTGDSGVTLSDPSYDANFQVSHWHEFLTGDGNNFFSSRLQGTRYKGSGSNSDRGTGRSLIGNSTGDESAIGDNDMAAMCYGKGWGYGRGLKGTGWKESKSSTCVNYYGNSSAQTVTHFMNAIPSFIIVKARGLSGSWRVYHSGLNEGSSPENYSLQLDDNAIGGNVFNGTAPTSTTFSVGTDSNVNSNNEPYIAYLWANSSYSKAGYYTGNGGSQTITTDFQPRFLVIRRYNVGANTSGAPDSSWIVFDTNRGWTSSGNDTVQWWNKNTGPTTNTDYCDPISTGFTLNSGEGYTNNNNDKYIYFAHA